MVFVQIENDVDKCCAKEKALCLVGVTEKLFNAV